jgi:integrase
MDSRGLTTLCPLTFRDAANHFLNGQKDRLSPASLIRLESMIKRFNTFFCDSMIIASISNKQVREFIRQRARESAPGSLRLEVGALKRIFRMAVEDGLIETNPASNISVPREKVNTRYLTPEDFCRVRSASPQWLQPILDFCVATGLARRELLSARWDDVTDTSGEISLCVPRGRAKRQVPLNRLAMQALLTIRDRSNSTKGRIFKGKSISSSNISQAFMRACRSAGVTDVSFKDLRHTSVHWMLQGGGSLGTIASFLGHANLQAAARYFRGENTRLDEAVRTIDRVADTADPRKNVQSPLERAS